MNDRGIRIGLSQKSPQIKERVLIISKKGFDCLYKKNLNNRAGELSDIEWNNLHLLYMVLLSHLIRHEEKFVFWFMRK